MTKYLKSKQQQQIIAFFDPDIYLPQNKKKNFSTLESVRGGTQPVSDSTFFSKWSLYALGHYL